ncbi:hypothetical protein EA004_27565, partial [Vibrio anguillarum]|nr:hypothetical protein [Vibrio anguillarum]
VKGYVIAKHHNFNYYQLLNDHLQYFGIVVLLFYLTTHVSRSARSCTWAFMERIAHRPQKIAS